MDNQKQENEDNIKHKATTERGLAPRPASDRMSSRKHPAGVVLLESVDTTDRGQL